MLLQMGAVIQGKLKWWIDGMELKWSIDGMGPCMYLSAVTKRVQVNWKARISPMSAAMLRGGASTLVGEFRLKVR